MDKLLFQAFTLVSALFNNRRHFIFGVSLPIYINRPIASLKYWWLFYYWRSLSASLDYRRHLTIGVTLLSALLVYLRHLTFGVTWLSVILYYRRYFTIIS